MIVCMYVVRIHLEPHANHNQPTYVFNNLREWTTNNRIESNKLN